MPHAPTRTAGAGALAVLGGLALVWASVAPASAHVTLVPSTTQAGAVSVLELEVPHGCAGSATTALSVRLPEGVVDVSVASTERWTAVHADGAVTFTTEDPLPDAMRDHVELSVRLPDSAGDRLDFPIVQRCRDGEAAWTEVAEDEASADELEMPAPFLVVTEASGASTSEPAPAPAATSGSSRLLAYGAAGAVLVGCLGSWSVLLLRRRRA